MTPDERQLLSGLFDRVRTASAQPRDRDAETLINDAVRTQPYAPYLLAQTVIVQEQALRAANERLQHLEARVQQLESGQSDSAGGTSFLGGLGQSIFGGPDQPSRGSVPSAGNAQQPSGGGYAPQGNPGYSPQGNPGFAPQGGPWGQGAGAAPQGGGFLKGALGMAAGVAGGALLGNAISGLFRGNPYGIGAGMPGLGGGYPGGGETIVNNYYENDGPPGDAGGDYGPGDGGGFDQSADFGSDDGGFGSDDGYNV